MSQADYSTEAGRGVVVRKQPPNVYTMMLLIAFVALLIGCLFLLLELNAYGLSVTVPPDAKVPPPGAVTWLPGEGSGLDGSGFGVQGSELGFRVQGSEIVQAWM